MFSPSVLSDANEHANEPIKRAWTPSLALTVSNFDPRFEGQLFSPTSPISAAFHRTRIKDLLFSPTTPISAELPSDQVAELPPPSPSSAHETMPPRGHSFHIPQPFPRSFDELHTERLYLIDCLQSENHKATEFLRTIATLGEKLVEENDSFRGRKKAKKRLRWLRHRLNETNRQEKRVLAHLAQLTLEIQTTERRTQVEYERRQREVDQQQYFDGFGMQQTRLNPEGLAP
jgi:hypothetical protein